MTKPTHRHPSSAAEGDDEVLVYDAMWSEVFSFAAGAAVGWVIDGLRVALAPRRDRFFRPLAGSPVSLVVDDDPEVIWAGYPNWIRFDYYVPVGVRS